MVEFFLEGDGGRWWDEVAKWQDRRKKHGEREKSSEERIDKERQWKEDPRVSVNKR